jgi:hypothetical protein
MATPIREPRTRIGGIELGVTNPQRVGTTLYEDFLPQLRGRKAQGVYEEMSSNDATVGAILYATEQLVRQVEWTVESDSDETTDFLQQNIDEIDGSWNDFISAALSEVVYGWAIFEVVYRPADGQIMWDKFGFRTQSSLHEWQLDDAGDLEAFVQTLSSGSTVAIPVGKLVHFRTSSGEGRPEGRSWLRRAYRSWFMKKRVEEITAIGIDRELNGVPKGILPAESLMAGPGNDEYDTMKAIITGVKVDESAGIMLPSDRDEDGNLYFDFDLISTTGRNKIDSLAYIRTLAMDIASVMLAQFIGLGRDAVGSRALAEPQQEMFQTALGALLDSMEEQFHQQATVKLLELNGMESGRIKHGELRDLDLEGISNFVLRIAQAGGDFFPPDGEGMDEFRQMAGLNPHDAVVIEDENVQATFTPTPGSQANQEADAEEEAG